MSFEKRLLEAQKKKGVSHEEVAKRLNIQPSIEAATKLARLQYYIVGNSDIEVSTDKLNRVLEPQTLSEDDKNTALKLLDAFLRDSKAKKAYVK